MTVLKITVLVLGLAFLSFGYLICFKKKYDLINDFKAEQEAGRRDARYAERVGRIELIVGAVLLLVAIVLLVFV